MRTQTAAVVAAPLMLLAGLLAALPVAPAHADDAAKEPEKIELTLAVKTGDVFHFRQKQNIDQTMKIGEMDVGSTIVVEQTMTYDVTAVREDGQADVKVTIGDIKGTFENTMFGTVEFDSSKPDDAASDNPMIGGMLKGFTMQARKSFTLTLDRRGGLVKVNGMKEILEEALKSNPAFAGKAMGGMLDDEGMKQQMQGQFALFADGPVAVGSKWKVDSDIKAPVAMKIATEYTLASADAKQAVVTSKSTFAAGAPEGAAAGTKMPNAETEGTVTVSRTDGLMLKSDTKTHTVMDMAMGGDRDGAAGGGQSMHMDMTVTVKIERVSAADAKPAEPKKAAEPKETAPPKTPAPAPDSPPVPK